MKPPRIEALRLITRVRLSRAPAVPLGARRWSDDAVDAAVLLDASSDPVTAAPQVAEQLPHASSLAAGSMIVVLGAALRGEALWRRLLRRRYVRISRVPLCGALLARGFVDVGVTSDAAIGADVAWGRVPDVVS